MSKKQKSVDPYAGQYPPPPPLPKHEAPAEPFYIIDPTTTNRHSFHEESIAGSSHSARPNRQSFHEGSLHNKSAGGSSHSLQQEHPKGHFYEASLHSGPATAAVTDDTGYYDPDAVDLREYLYAERQQKLRVQQQEREQQEYQQKMEYQKQLDYHKPIMDAEDPYRHHHARPDSMFYNNNQAYQNEELMYPSPMMVQPIFNHQQNSALFSPPPHFIPNFPPIQTQTSNPSMLRPPLPAQHRRSGCCCLGISFCACIWTIILALFFLAGIGLIVATKIIGDKCTDTAGICGQLLHDGFLYGGIAIAGTSALIIAWRVLRWYGHTRGEQTQFTNTH
ncbi:uncharacterized protein EV154DRAFT_549997 [Mucor mucedo]|uniref:uncharacterized protein n=1 Tax=Mucor mucedo TaxID=29922 RepID=UPI002220AFE3|nr:uncharacterized protein EV154DRAFT_549997 [Mucor mucedo]KAI7893436.1 hypothetical protein EV154DRAFT_549997 [Mucor mucedo]